MSLAYVWGAPSYSTSSSSAVPGPGMFPRMDTVRDPREYTSYVPGHRRFPQPPQLLQQPTGPLPPHSPFTTVTLAPEPGTDNMFTTEGIYLKDPLSGQYPKTPISWWKVGTAAGLAYLAFNYFSKRRR